MADWLLMLFISANAIAVCMGNGQRNSEDDAESIKGDIVRIIGGRNAESVRIIGGTNATDSAWPWHVSVKYKRRFMCGGTLLNADTVLTAAHCIIARRPRRFRVTAGDYDRRAAEPDRNEQTVRVKRIYVHPGYSRTTLKNDVAILKLTTPVDFGTHIQPIELATAAMDISPTTCYITGWGMRDSKDKKSMVNILQQAAVSVISNAECQKGFIEYAITEDMMCTEDRTRATCNGDSGGPLQCEIEAGRWVQVGITSWGNDDCLIGPSVYSRVSYNRAWISDRM